MDLDLFSLPPLPAGPVPDKLAWAYLLRCGDGSLYAGWTSDLPRRIAAHTAGKGARYTRARKAAGLAWCALLPNKSIAMRAEAALKRLDKPRKEALCAAWADAMRPRLFAAAPTDAADIAAVYGWYVRNSTATFAYTEPSTEDWAAEIAAASARYPFLVARSGSGALLGYACAHPWGSREAFRWDVETTIYCHPGAVGQGLARPLYAVLLEALTEYYPGAKRGGSSKGHKLAYVYGETQGVISVPDPAAQLPVGTLQNFLDWYLARHKGGRVDYIHGEDVVRKLAAQPDTVGFLLPAMGKEELFPTVIPGRGAPPQDLLHGGGPRQALLSGGPEDPGLTEMKSLAGRCRCGNTGLCQIESDP